MPLARRGAFLCEEIAEHCRDEPTVAGYGMVNAPQGKMSSDSHDADRVGALDEMIRAIRQVDAGHLSFCTGPRAGSRGTAARPRAAGDRTDAAVVDPEK